MTKNLVKKVICFAVMAVVMIALIIGDVFAWRYSLLVDGILGINDTDFSNASAELQAGDKLVVELEEDSMKTKLFPLRTALTNLTCSVTVLTPASCREVSEAALPLSRSRRVSICSRLLRVTFATSI